MGGSIWTFIGIAILVIVTPGPDTALTIRNSLLGGRSGGLATACGVAAGQTIWAFAASVGIAGLLAASEPAFAVIRYAGAAYLVYLGIGSLRAAVRGEFAHDLPARDVPIPRLAPLPAFRQGILSNLANPKMAVFFLSLLPPFAPGGEASIAALAVLGLLFAAMTLTWLSLYTLAIARVSAALQKPRVHRMLEGITGAALVALGLRLAAEHR